MPEIRKVAAESWISSTSQPALNPKSMSSEMDPTNWRAGWDMINTYSWKPVATAGYNPNLPGVAPTYKDAMLRYYPIDERIIRAGKLKEDFGPNATWKTMREHYYPLTGRDNQVGDEGKGPEGQDLESGEGRSSPTNADAATEFNAPTPGMAYSDEEDLEDLRELNAVIHPPDPFRFDNPRVPEIADRVVEITRTREIGESEVMDESSLVHEPVLTLPIAPTTYEGPENGQGSKACGDPAEPRSHSQDVVLEPVSGGTPSQLRLNDFGRTTSVADFDREVRSARMTSSPEESGLPVAAGVPVRPPSVGSSGNAFVRPPLTESATKQSNGSLCSSVKDESGVQHQGPAIEASQDMPLKLSPAWHQQFNKALSAQGADDQEAAVIKEAMREVERTAKLKDVVKGIDAVEVKDSGSAASETKPPKSEVPFSIFDHAAFGKTIEVGNKMKSKKLPARLITAYSDDEFLAMKWHLIPDTKLESMDADDLRLLIRSIKSLTRYYNGISKKETIAQIESWQEHMKPLLVAQEAATVDADESEEEGDTEESGTADSGQNEEVQELHAAIDLDGDVEMHVNSAPAAAAQDTSDSQALAPSSSHSRSSAIVPRAADTGQDVETPTLKSTNTGYNVQTPFNRSSSLKSSAERSVFLDPDAPPRDSPLIRKLREVRIPKDEEQVGEKQEPSSIADLSENRIRKDSVRLELDNDGDDGDDDCKDSSGHQTAKQVKLNDIGKEIAVEVDRQQSQPARTTRSTRSMTHQAVSQDLPTETGKASTTSESFSSKTTKVHVRSQSAAAEQTKRGTKRKSEEPTGDQSRKRSLRSASAAPTKK